MCVCVCACVCASFFSWHHMVYCYMCVCVDGGKSDEDPREAHDDLRDGQDQPTRSVSMCRICCDLVNMHKKLLLVGR